MVQTLTHQVAADTVCSVEAVSYTHLDVYKRQVFVASISYNFSSPTVQKTLLWFN